MAAQDPHTGGDADTKTRLVIVSNRGPVTFSSGESGERDYSRGAGGLVTALNAVARRRRRPSGSPPPRARRTRASRGRSPRPTRSRTCGSCSSSTTRKPTTSCTTVSPTHCSGSSSTASTTTPYRPRLGDDTRRAWEEGYVPVNRNFAEAVARTPSPRRRRRGAAILSTTTSSTWPRSFVRERLGDRTPLSPSSSTSPGPSPMVGASCRATQGRRPGEPPLGQRRRLPHPRLRPQLRPRPPPGSSASRPTRRRASCGHDGREVWVRAYPISIDPAEFEELAESDAVLEQEEFVQNLPGKLSCA